MANSLPLAITMGDPAGTGPEIIAKASAERAFPADTRIVCVGDAGIMQKAAALFGDAINIHVINRIEDARFEPGVLDVLHLSHIDLTDLRPGKVQAIAGHAAYEYVARSIQAALDKQVAGVVTSALNKEALHLAGHKYDGHTEIFAALTGTRRVVMMLASGDFRVTHVSTHVSLQRAIERVRPDRILDVLRVTDRSLRGMGIASPHIAVAGLNPHSGENGLFGDEEAQYIQPAINQAINEGIKVSPRPEPPDTVYVRMLHFKSFDAVVAQYHDQGHIAAKLVDFWGGVNITLGLPIIRTSVDHGTAFDLVGTGKARIDSLVNAVAYAQRMANAK
jgi:4-hydroxythreonine-4-phosphate dehydrogenase